MAKHIAIIGAGNGGQAFAGYLSLLGEDIKIFDIVPETVRQLSEKGGVTLEGNGKVSGFGKIMLASTDIGEVVKGAKTVLVILPATYHKDMATKMVPYLEDGQIVVLSPHASLGPIEFKNQLDSLNCKANIILSCTSTLLFACRALEVGRVHIAGQKKHLTMSAYPSSNNHILKEAFGKLLPEWEVIGDVIHTSLDNINALVHPGPTILNTGRIESKVPFEYYRDMTPSQGRYIDAMDLERMALAKAYGLTHVIPLIEEYPIMYNTHGKNMYEILSNNEDLKGIMGATTLSTRYLSEDVPCSLVAFQTLGKIAGVPTPCVDALITIGKVLLPEIEGGRTVEYLGLEGLSKEEFMAMCRK